MVNSPRRSLQMSKALEHALQLYCSHSIPLNCIFQQAYSRASLCTSSPKPTHVGISPCAFPHVSYPEKGRGGGVGGGQPKTLLFTAFLLVCTAWCRRMFFCSGTRGAVTSVHNSANMPKTLPWTACLTLSTTCCRRMFDVQQHGALSQVFMPSCKHAQISAIYSGLRLLKQRASH